MRFFIPSSRQFLERGANLDARRRRWNKERLIRLWKSVRSTGHKKGDWMRNTFLTLAMLSSLGVGVVRPQAVVSPAPDAKYDATRAQATNPIPLNGKDQKDEPAKDNASPEKLNQTRGRSPKKSARRQDQQPSSDCWVSRTCVDP